MAESAVSLVVHALLVGVGGVIASILTIGRSFGLAWWQHCLITSPVIVVVGVLFAVVSGGYAGAIYGWGLPVIPPLLAGVLIARGIVNEQRDDSVAVTAIIATIATFAFPFYLNIMDGLGGQTARALHDAPHSVANIHGQEIVATVVYIVVTVGGLALTGSGTSGQRAKPTARSHARASTP